MRDFQLLKWWGMASEGLPITTPEIGSHHAPAEIEFRAVLRDRKKQSSPLLKQQASDGPSSSVLGTILASTTSPSPTSFSREALAQYIRRGKFMLRCPEKTLITNGYS